jgi:hypothetical protein
MEQLMKNQEEYMRKVEKGMAKLEAAYNPRDMRGYFALMRELKEDCDDFCEKSGKIMVKYDRTATVSVCKLSCQDFDKFKRELYVNKKRSILTSSFQDLFK